MVRRVLFLLIFCAVVISSLPSCESDSSNTTGPRKFVDTLYLRDYEYAMGRVYDLGASTDFQPMDRVIGLSVYEGRPRARDEEANELSVAVVSADDTSPSGLTTITQRVERLGDDKFVWFDDPVTNRHFVVFNTVRDSYLLGVQYKVIRNGNSADTVTIGSLDQGDTLQLKMIRTNGLNYPSKPAWSYMWRNVYALPWSTDRDQLDIRVFKGAVGTEGTDQATEFQQSTSLANSYLAILGLDQWNEGGLVKSPDGMVDVRPDVLRRDWGLVVIPNRIPFDSDTTYVDYLGGQTPELADKVPTLYNYQAEDERIANSRYFLQIIRTTPPHRPGLADQG